MNRDARDESVRRAMAEAADLARRGRFRVEPNPLVGAVVLSADGSVVGRGYHARWGGAHAEVGALAEAGDRARGGTLVVTLEPCGHVNKKTPPCVPLVVASGVARVVAGSADPNPDTRGLAADAFARAGIAWETGVLREACDELLGRYERALLAEVPWVIAKWAMSADGRIADSGGHSRWITGAQSREVVQELRASVDAVVVGRGTVEADDPLLTVRTAAGGSSPVRVVLDTDLRTPDTARVVQTAREARTLFYCAEGADPARRAAVEARGAEVAAMPRGPNGHVKLGAAFRDMRKRGIRRVLLEAGGVLTGATLRAGCVRQVAAFTAPVVIGGSGPTPFDGGGWPISSAPRLENARVTACGGDSLLEGYWPRGGAAS
ncbi:MAG: Riboflavin biosynthesis protein RibD [Planctomycetes bacterium]|nr:Riboflavin biosynthesis protein RibD [Planctomycetota bacterium]